MIHNIKSFLIFFVIVTVIGCSKDALSPEISFTVDNANPKVGDTITFSISGDAETFVIFTGDASHEFMNSHIAVTEGQDLNQELVLLTSDGLVNLTPWLENIVNNYNAGLAPGNTALNINTIIANLETLVDKEYTNKLTATYEAYLFMEELTGDVAKNMVNLYYENRSVLLAPQGGFSTGVAIDRYKNTYEYIYSGVGTYIVTLVATNVGDKQYSGSGYQDDRTASGDEYNLNRSIKELIITVQP